MAQKYVHQEISSQKVGVSGLRDREVVVYDRETLYREVWSEPVSAVAKRYKISDNALRKHCNKLNVPLPPRGYWVQSEPKRRRQVPPLPKGNGLDKITVVKQPSTSTPPGGNQPDRLSFLPEDRRTEILDYCDGLAVPEEMGKQHPLVASTMRYHKSRNRSNNPVDPKDVLAIGTSAEQLPRALRIMNTILKAVEYLEYSVKNTTRDTRVCIGREEIRIGIKEKQTQVPHVLTPDEEKDKAKYGRTWARSYDFVYTSLLILYIDEYRAKRKNWKDTERKKVEGSVGEFIVAIIQTAEDLRALREQREAEERARQEAKIRRLELEMRRDEETKRFQLLNQRSNDYEAALRIRTYVSALTDKLSEITDEREKAKALEYVQWAKAKADWLDPLVNRRDPLLGLRHDGIADYLEDDDDE